MVMMCRAAAVTSATAPPDDHQHDPDESAHNPYPYGDGSENLAGDGEQYGDGD